MKAEVIASPMTKPCIEIRCPWCTAGARHFTYEAEEAQPVLDQWLAWHVAEKHPEKMRSAVDSATDLQVCA